MTNTPPASINATDNSEATKDDAAASCCGGPAPAGAAACCVQDAAAKAAGESGCGCGTTVTRAKKSCC